MRYLIFILLFCFNCYSQQTIEICDDSKTFSYFTSSTEGGTVEWDINGITYVGNEITLTFSNSGIYVLTAISHSNGCYSLPQTYTVTVIECDPLLYWVPNTFTPNNDEYNTTWGPIFEGPYEKDDFHLVVLNRWGNLIWESWNAELRWDGTYNNKLVTDGVYTWVIDFGILGTDERRLIHGHVTIIR